MRKWQAKARRGGFLLAMTVLVASCTDEQSTAPKQKLEDSAQLQKSLDSAAAQQVAAFAPPSNVNGIPLAAGDSIEVTVLSSECSGDPETVVAQGVISGLVASGTCNAGGTINGQTIKMGPASSAGSVAFYATHQVFGAGAPAPVTGPDASGSYGAFLDDGASFPDYNDVIISIRILNPKPGLVCTTPVQRGSGASCEVRGGGEVTGWQFNGQNWDGSKQIIVPGPTGGNKWEGIVVASGTVTANVTVNGSSSALTATVSVSNRPWKWVKAQHWSYARTALPGCEPRPYEFGAEVLLGWTVQKGTCVSSPLTPNPQQFPNEGWVLQEISSGPNAHLWYVSDVTYRMDMESNINSSIKPGNGPFRTLVSSADKTACKKAKLTAPNFYDYNAVCRKLNVQAFIDGIWNHEGYGPGNNLAGHQAQLELYALFPEGDPYQSLERIFDDNQAAANLTAILKAQAVNQFLNDKASSHSNVNGGYCGDTWQWNTSTNQYVLAPALGPRGRCF